MHNVIGGYFELELSRHGEYHQDAIHLNTGRNSFEYILRAKEYKKVYLPYYTCDVMLESIRKLSIDHEFYHIDENFSPKFNSTKLKEADVVVYTNYFGICGDQLSDIAEKSINLIVDNSQAFFAKHIEGIDTFYSARKFFGVPDGAYLYTDKFLTYHIEQDKSYGRFEHLLGRIDVNAEKFYSTFKKNDDGLKNQPIKIMSKLTNCLLKSVDYEDVKKKRRENFLFLHDVLKNQNELILGFKDDFVPMVYPLLIKNGEKLKNKLIENKIFVATYWPNVKDWVDNYTYESKLVNQLIALPIDQRYTISDMKDILSIF